MPRPPLELETWGRIRRTIIDGKHAAVAYYRDADGKTRKMQRTGKTGADAERNLVKAMKARLAPTGEDLTADTTVKQAAEKWLAEPERSELAIASVRRYSDILGTIVKDGFGGVRLGEATVPRVDRFLKTVTAGHGPSTAKTARTLLQHVFALAVRHGAIQTNPVRDVGRIVQPRKPVVAPDAHSIREMAALGDRTHLSPGSFSSEDGPGLFCVSRRPEGSRAPASSGRCLGRYLLAVFNGKCTHIPTNHYAPGVPCAA